jgi:hypothetical protein
MAMDIWTYVITHNCGSAPNFEKPATTLAICKPRIRAKAEKGDVVLAFNGKPLNRDQPHSVCWAGVVSKTMKIRDYWNDKHFTCKKQGQTQVPDNIYMPIRNGRLKQVNNDIHQLQDAERDKGGKNVLVFEKRWHFGENGPVLPEYFHLRMGKNARRSHRRYRNHDNVWPELQQWLAEQKQTPPPTSATSCSSCGPCRRMHRGQKRQKKCRSLCRQKHIL